jgi:hypothetical protein
MEFTHEQRHAAAVATVSNATASFNAFDHDVVFSNFGGQNCLQAVLESISYLLGGGASITRNPNDNSFTVSSIGVEGLIKAGVDSPIFNALRGGPPTKSMAQTVRGA